MGNSVRGGYRLMIGECMEPDEPATLAGVGVEAPNGSESLLLESDEEVEQAHSPLQQYR